MLQYIALIRVGSVGWLADQWFNFRPYLLYVLIRWKNTVLVVYVIPYPYCLPLPCFVSMYNKHDDNENLVQKQPDLFEDPNGSRLFLVYLACGYFLHTYYTCAQLGQSGSDPDESDFHFENHSQNSRLFSSIFLPFLPFSELHLIWFFKKWCKTFLNDRFFDFWGFPVAMFLNPTTSFNKFSKNAHKQRISEHFLNNLEKFGKFWKSSDKFGKLHENSAKISKHFFAWFLIFFRMNNLFLASEYSTRGFLLKKF